MSVEVLASAWRAIEPQLPLLITVLAVLIVLMAPLPGRGPVSSRKDEWRSFKFAARRAVMDRAGGRCEAPALIVWGRCSEKATDADHIYPWSRGGPTIVSNGQALCRRHNLSKGSLPPPWWLVLGLERRREAYVPRGMAVRVSARVTEDDRRMRDRGDGAANHRR